MESQSISKNLFFMVFSFSKKEITRKAVWIELWLDTSIHGLIFLKIKGSY